MGLVYQYPPKSSGGTGNGVAVYATFADFPPSAANGQLAVALDTDFLYVFNTGSSSWVLIAAPGSSGIVINRFTLTPTDISNKYVTLSATPSVDNDTLLTVIGGPLQNYGPDYIVSGNQLSWSGLTLDGILVSGDDLVVQFNQ